MRCSLWFSGLMVCCFAAGCAASGGSLPDTATVVETEVYEIGAEDVLEIAVWQNPDVSRTVTVRPDGNISLPLVGDVKAAGLFPEQLKDSIREKLEPFMASDPEVSVIVVQVNSKRFIVQGEVNRPGVFPLRTRTTVTHAITLAGGFSEFARQNRIRVVRSRQGRQETIRVNYKRILKGRPEEDIVLRPDDIIIVP
jgi:polysaccharide biosynthesis/export protein